MNIYVFKAIPLKTKTGSIYEYVGLADTSQELENPLITKNYTFLSWYLISQLDPTSDNSVNNFTEFLRNFLNCKVITGY